MIRARAPTHSRNHSTVRTCGARIFMKQPPSALQTERKTAHMGYLDVPRAERAKAEVMLMRTTSEGTDQEMKTDMEALHNLIKGRPLMNVVEFLRATYTTFRGEKIEDWQDRLVAIPARQFGEEWADSEKLCHNTLLLAFMLEKPERYHTLKGSTERFGAYFVLLDKEISTESVGQGQFFKVVGEELQRVMQSSQITLPYHRDEDFTKYHVAYDEERANEWTESQMKAFIKYFKERQVGDATSSQTANSADGAARGAGGQERGRTHGAGGVEEGVVIQAVQVITPNTKVIMATQLGGQKGDNSRRVSSAGGEEEASPSKTLASATTGKASTANEHTEDSEGSYTLEGCTDEEADEFMRSLSTSSLDFGFQLPQLQSEEEAATMPSYELGLQLTQPQGSTPDSPSYSPDSPLSSPSPVSMDEEGGSAVSAQSESSGGAMHTESTSKDKVNSRGGAGHTQDRARTFRLSTAAELQADEEHMARAPLMKQPTRRGSKQGRSGGKGAGRTKAEKRRPRMELSRESIAISKSNKAREKGKKHRSVKYKEAAAAGPAAEHEAVKMAGATQEYEEGPSSPSTLSSTTTFSSTQSGSSQCDSECFMSEDENEGGRAAGQQQHVFYTQAQVTRNKIDELAAEFTKMKESRAGEGRPGATMATNTGMRGVMIQIYGPVYSTPNSGQARVGACEMAPIKSALASQPHIVVFRVDNNIISVKGFMKAINGVVPHTVKEEDRLVELQYVQVSKEVSKGKFSTGAEVFPTGIMMKGRGVRSSKQLQNIVKKHNDNLGELLHMTEQNKEPVMIAGEPAQQRLLLRLGVVGSADRRKKHHAVMKSYAEQVLSEEGGISHFTVEARVVFSNALTDSGTQTNTNKIKAIINAASFYGFKNPHRLVQYLERWTVSEVEEIIKYTPLLGEMNPSDCHRLASQLWQWGRMTAIMDYPFTMYGAGHMENEMDSEEEDETVKYSFDELAGSGSESDSSRDEGQNDAPYSMATEQQSSQTTQGMNACCVKSLHEVMDKYAEDVKSLPRQLPTPPSQPCREEIEFYKRCKQREQREKVVKQEKLAKNSWHVIGGGQVNKWHDNIDKSKSPDKAAIRQAHVNVNFMVQGFELRPVCTLLNLINQNMDKTYVLENSAVFGGAPGAGKTETTRHLAEYLYDEMGLLGEDVQAGREHWEDFGPELEEYMKIRGPDTTKLAELQHAVLDSAIEHKPVKTEGVTYGMDRCGWDAAPFAMQGLMQGRITADQVVKLFERIGRQTCLPQIFIFMECQRHTAMMRLEERQQAGDSKYTWDSLGDTRAYHEMWKAIVLERMGEDRVKTVLNDGTIDHAGEAAAGIIHRAANTLQGMQGTRSQAARREQQRMTRADEARLDTEMRERGHAVREDIKMVRFNISLIHFMLQGETYRARFDVTVLNQDTPNIIISKLCMCVVHDTGKAIENDATLYTCYAEQSDMFAHAGQEVPIDSNLQPRELNSYTVIMKEKEEKSTYSNEQLKSILNMLQDNMMSPVNSQAGGARYEAGGAQKEASNTRGLRLKKGARNPFAAGRNVPLGGNGVPSEAAQNKFFNNTDPEFTIENLEEKDGVSKFPSSMLEDTSASRHCTLDGTPLHPNCPRPIRDIPEKGVVYVEFFGEQTTEIEDLLNEAEDFMIGANGAVVQQVKKLKPFRHLGDYMQGADSMDLWMINTGRFTQQDSLEHRCYVRSIRDLCELYTWEAVIKYDHMFRALKSAGAINTWGEHRPELVCKVLLPGLKSARPRQQQARQQQTRPQKRKTARTSGREAAEEPARKKSKTSGRVGDKRDKPPCRRFNTKEGCKMTPNGGPGGCWFTHQCSVPGCGSKAHGAHDHK